MWFKWVFAACLGAAAGMAAAGSVCEVRLTGCPGLFANRTVKVPAEAIWLDAEIPACHESVQITGGKTPSIVFIIDNSGSMDEFDPAVARFKVVMGILDDLYALAPATEVGLVVFTRRLSFDHRENPFFRTAFPNDPGQHDSFVPLTALNMRFPDGRTGLDTLKALLKHDSRGNLFHVTRLPASRANEDILRSDTRNGTDITLGFQAAKVAMRDARSEKEDQYFVFLSDGAPSDPDEGRVEMMEDFVAGTATPTTFTVFFDPGNTVPVAPAAIVRMTGNIKANGYSRSNVKSAYWAIGLPGSQLQDLLRNEVIGNALSMPAQPKSATLTSGDSVRHNVALDSGAFVFSRRLKLEPDTTRLRLDFTYTYEDTSGGRREIREKTVPYALTLVREPGAPLPAGMERSCREQGDLALFHQGKAVARVAADQVELEARLTLPAGAACGACTLAVEPSSGGSRDRESLALAPLAGYLAGTFRREISASPAPGDGVLQHASKDSIVLVFVNPENPLDRLRKSVPYAGAPPVLELGRRNDYARAKISAAAPSEPQWVLMAPHTLIAAPANPSDHWRMLPGPVSPVDSLRYVGMSVEASRAFRVDIRVYSNLGQFVNKVAFTIGPAEFPKLEKTGKGDARRISVLWDGRSQQGVPAGTGAYVLKTTVTLLNLPGAAEDEATRSDYRRIGVLRSH